MRYVRAKRRKTETIRTKLVEKHVKQQRFLERNEKKLIQYQGHLAIQLIRRIGSEQVSEIFLTKYKTLFKSVPACDSDLERLHAVIHENVEPDKRINFDIIQQCSKKLKMMETMVSILIT